MKREPSFLMHPYYPEILKFKSSLKTSSTLSTSNHDDLEKLSAPGDYYQNMVENSSIHGDCEGHSLRKGDKTF